jgi:hypothetical protein
MTVIINPQWQFGIFGNASQFCLIALNLRTMDQDLYRNHFGE